MKKLKKVQYNFEFIIVRTKHESAMYLSLKEKRNQKSQRQVDPIFIKIEYDNYF